MWKRIISWSIFAGFVGLMVFGAVNRTSAKADKYSNDLIRTEERSGQAQGGNGLGNRKLSENDHQEEGAWVNKGTGQYSAENQSRVSGNGKGMGSGKVFYTEDPETHDQAVITGVVAEVFSDSVEVQVEDFSIYEIEGRSWRYIIESDFLLEEGNLLEMSGFFEDGEYKIITISNLSSGQTLQVREETGRPYWSGGRSGE
jgi:hypothetical protein